MAARTVLRLPVGCLSRSTAHTQPFLLDLSAAFSTTARRCKRKTKDGNKKRGVSALYRSGPKEPLAASHTELPKPREVDRSVEMDKTHGLWGFFPAPGKMLLTPAETDQHGRQWTVEELRKKSWEDLHSLWWVCCKERNMLSTTRAELDRGQYGFGELEIDERDRVVVKTMRNIKHALTERYYTWEDAVEAAKNDPEIDLAAKPGSMYKPTVPKQYGERDDGWTALEPAENGKPTEAKPLKPTHPSNRLFPPPAAATPSPHFIKPLSTTDDPIPTDAEHNMDEIAKEYDVIVLGTGLTECILSGVLSVKGRRVLHVDRNNHYGGEAASVNLETLFKKYGNFQKGEEPWKKYGRPNDWNIDLIPKFLMSSGELTNILVSTDVTRYLEFKQVAGSYVQQGADSKATVAKVPSDAAEALKSALMGIFEKRRMKSFIEWVGQFDIKDPATHKGLDMNQCTMKDVYDKFGLEATTRDFTGHAMALCATDDYINAKGEAPEIIERIRLYGNSVSRYGKSPYIYPLYGLGELPQGFARLSAIYGGTYMLNTSVDEIIYDGEKAVGIKATMSTGTEDVKFETKSKMILGDPSYFPGKTKVVGQVLRAICILNHPLAGTSDSDSCQLIIPQSQVGRKNDIYIACVSSAHNVCPKGYWIAIVSTIAETAANHHLELQPGLERLGKIEEQFMGPPIPVYEPLESGAKDNIFISKSYDATSHFETTTDDVKDIYQRCTGEELKVEGLREGINVTSEG
ncbi:hypothetical protein CP533_0057 [Ophiocordyceps camponoti-saundersi (nom. inval.)]|nr:hypothetical protein CP533_0057 [Ophiocordyceps camponoti-saundersi (nom. inval.)]